MKRDLLICKCENLEHQLIFTYIDDSEKLITVSVLLNNYSFFKRLIFGIKYIFGYRSKFGLYDEFIINPEDKDKFLNIYNFLKNN